MALQLYMIGLMTRDMEKAQEFYRRLGVAIPAGTQHEPHVEVKMGNEFTFFLDSRNFMPDTSLGQALEPCRVMFEYYLGSQAAVKAKYAELIDYGYQSYHAPFIFPNGMCFAFVNDPDGNTILLSGDVESASTTQSHAS